MTRGVSDALGYGWFSLLLVSFLLMVVAFTRLFRTAWKAPDRAAQVKKVLNVQPHKNREWPNNTSEATMIAVAAALGLLFFAVGFVLFVLVIR